MDAKFKEMSVPETGKEILGIITEARTETLLVIAIALIVWSHGLEVGELSNQLKATNFMMGISDCETQECRDRFITTFTDWINLRKAGCE